MQGFWALLPELLEGGKEAESYWMAKAAKDDDCRAEFAVGANEAPMCGPAEPRRPVSVMAVGVVEDENVGRKVSKPVRLDVQSPEGRRRSDDNSAQVHAPGTKEQRKVPGCRPSKPDERQNAETRKHRMAPAYESTDSPGGEGEHHAANTDRIRVLNGGRVAEPPQSVHRGLTPRLRRRQNAGSLQPIVRASHTICHKYFMERRIQCSEYRRDNR